MKVLLALPLVLLLAACAGKPQQPDADGAAADAVAPAPSSASSSAPAVARKPPQGGGYYRDDGPPDALPFDLAAIPDAQPRDEPLHRFANRPYNVLGRDYLPHTARKPFRQRGVASWYGRKFHGEKTSSGEIYDMFAMTAAHPTLPIPSYVRVSRPDAGKAVVVRVNDRGPFLHGRIIDLSYAAAWKLGLVENGSGAVLVESILPGSSPAAEEPPRSAAKEAPVVVLRDIEETGGHYLQLGAFGSRENAEALKEKLARTLGALGERLTIRSGGHLHRLHLGPWTDIEEARRQAEQLRVAFDLPSVLVK